MGGGLGVGASERPAQLLWNSSSNCLIVDFPTHANQLISN
jgi:hypothetical protein